MRDPILESTAALASAVARGDAHAAGEVYTDGARLLAPTADLISGRREIQAYWRAGIDLGLTGLELELRELQLVERVAVEIGRYGISANGAGGVVIDRGTYVVLHRPEADGSWHRAVDVFNPDGPPARLVRKEGA
jgi:ketosteroid isomerase-like protein